MTSTCVSDSEIISGCTIWPSSVAILFCCTNQGVFTPCTISLPADWLLWTTTQLIHLHPSAPIPGQAIWWRHQMETFSALLALCAGNSPVTSEFPAKVQWPKALMFSFICVWINAWVNNREAADLRRHRVHYDVIVMKSLTNRTCLNINTDFPDICISILKIRRSSDGLIYIMGISILVRRHLFIGTDPRSREISKLSNKLLIHYNERDGVSKAPASRLFTQPFIQAQIKKNTKAQRHLPLCGGNSSVTGEFPAQKDSGAEKVSIWWRHHGLGSCGGSAICIGSVDAPVKC